jgi:hypothetical protein
MLYWNEIINDLAKIHGTDVVLTLRKNAWKKISIFPLRYYANCVSTTLTVLILHKVESVYFFYSNPVFQTYDTAVLTQRATTL